MPRRLAVIPFHLIGKEAVAAGIAVSGEMGIQVTFAKIGDADVGIGVSVGDLNDVGLAEREDVQVFFEFAVSLGDRDMLLFLTAAGFGEGFFKVTSDDDFLEHVAAFQELDFGVDLRFSNFLGRLSVGVLLGSSDQIGPPLLTRNFISAS